MRSRILWGILVVLSLALALPLVALAHEEIEVGPYTLEVGWVDEPPLVGVKNGVSVSIVRTDGSEPVEDITTLEVTVSTGGKDLPLELHPAGEDQPGLYAAEFIPTRRGVYTVKLSGKIEETDVDASVDIEEVADSASLQFPEPLPDLQAASRTAEQAQGAASTAQTLAVIGIVVGAVGLALGLWGLRRR